MLTRYLKIAFRNIWKYKTQSITGIFGLAFGLACLIPALYWMRYETSYDSSYPDAENIYRIYTVDKQSGKVNELIPGILEKKLHEHFPGTEISTIFYPEVNNCKTEEISHIRLRMLNTDSTFFRVFKQEFVSGDSWQPLQTIYNIVLTESVAIRLFGDAEKAIGQQVQSTFYFFHQPYMVTAVVKDPPIHSNMQFDALLFHDLLPGMAGLPEDMQWLQPNAQLYVKFPPHMNVRELAEQLRDFTSRLNVNDEIELHIAPISDVRHQLKQDVSFTLNFIRLFIAAGILLLFSAVFNFLNLYHALFRQRIRELRLRSVNGASGGQLIRQLMFELSCSIVLALLFAWLGIILVSPAFSRLLDIEMEVPQLVRLFLVCGICVIALILFISFILFRRLTYLATQDLSKIKIAGQPILRRVAVILQLIVSIIFIVAALVITMQIHFMNRKDLGISNNEVIQLHGLPPYLQMKLRTALLHELQSIPQVQSITTSNFEPQHNAKTEEMITRVEWPGKQGNEEFIFNLIPTDHQFAEIMGLKMLAGEWYKEGGEQNVVLNEEAVRTMGLKDPVGTVLRISIYDVDMELAEQELDVKYRVVGVVNDFHTLSLRSRIYPTIFRYEFPSATARIAQNNIMYIGVTPGQEQEAIRKITAILPGVDPSFADLRLTTVSGLYDQLNYSEQAGLKLFSVLAIVCLFISLFGVYAVAAAATQRRRKEVAIRKIVGAEAGNIVRMFFREYALLVVIACLIALPLAYMVMNNWLQGYAYRTNIPWWLLGGVFAGVILIVLLTVLGQTLKTANSNPGEVVKSE